MFVRIPPNNKTCPECPASEAESAGKAIYGLIGVAVFVTAKYFYPSVKKFFVRICGTNQPDDHEARQASILRALPAMMPELRKMIRDHESPPIPTLTNNVPAQDNVGNPGQQKKTMGFSY
jgi:hypothetical protein